MIHLRDEKKPFERRSPLTPTTASMMIKDGWEVVVEKSRTRIYQDELFEKVGCKMAESQSWVNSPLDCYILGLKEILQASSVIPYALKHKHIYFAHCYKGQADWKETMQRFVEGKGELIDLEYLQDDSGRRLAAFGHSAGYMGAGIGISVWCHQQLKGFDEKCPSFFPYESKQDLITELKASLSKVSAARKTSENYKPTVLIVGALGRCGKGSVECCRSVGIEPIQWDLEETKNGGPFKEFLNVDILINCIYLNGKISPFLTNDLFLSAGNNRKLSVFVDVSCDATNENNPYPIYHQVTNFSNPTLRVFDHLDVVAIDNLPTLIPRESSEDFSNALVPHLTLLKSAKLDGNESPNENERVWIRARKLFETFKQKLT